jgi:[acyl-carrier-protein] S-malonyltransferase
MSEDIQEGGMVAVMGLPPDELVKVLPGSVDIATYNGPAQTIISGRREDLVTALIHLKNAGARRVITLAVSGPFHSSYMNEAGSKLKYFLKDIQISKPVIPFLSSVSGKYESDPDKIRLLLSSQLSSPVQWTEVMSMLSGKVCAETGPGDVLHCLAKRMPNGPKVYSAATPDLCREFVQLWEREYEAFD